jgi:hypothetical protein
MKQSTSYYKERIILLSTENVELRARAEKAEREAHTNAVLMAEEAGKLIEATARADRIERETIERCAKVVEEAMVGDVDSEIARGAADAYNDTNPHAMVHERLERMGQFIAAAIRAMKEGTP